MEVDLEAIINYYLNSGDFNGLPVYSSDGLTSEATSAVQTLVRNGLVQVVSEQDFLNPHIRPWPSKRSEEEQSGDVAAIRDGTRMSICLYPTPTVMEGRAELARWSDAPYTLSLAAGRGQLELAYFSLDVLEPYRNDPRYRYSFHDFEVEFGIGDDAYMDPAEAARDKIASVRAGFAYDVTTLESDLVRRYVCTFLTDLSDLTPEHQRRWQSYVVESAANIRPHPVWWGMMMGHWADGLGPFDKILSEMTAVNELFVLAWGQDLFGGVERPREWGWLLRATTASWHEFVLVTDKLLSDNIRHDTLTAAGVPRDDTHGKPMGSLQRLEWFLVEVAHVPSDDATAVLEPMRAIRAERQRPAHALDAPRTDSAVAARQRDILLSIAQSLMNLRTICSSHPTASGWTPPDYLEEKWYRL